MEVVKVLYVDDDSMDRMRCARLFKHTKHVDGKTTGDFEPSSWQLFDYMILDLNIGDINPAEVLKYASLNVIVVSGQSNLPNVYDKTYLPLIVSSLTRNQVDTRMFTDIQPKNYELHEELKEVSLLTLRDRLDKWEKFSVEAVGFEQLRHKSISTFKSCGMDTNVLEAMKNVDDVLERVKLAAILKHQIGLAVSELNDNWDGL